MLYMLTHSEGGKEKVIVDSKEVPKSVFEASNKMDKFLVLVTLERAHEKEWGNEKTPKTSRNQGHLPRARLNHPSSPEEGKPVQGEPVKVRERLYTSHVPFLYSDPWSIKPQSAHVERQKRKWIKTPSPIATFQPKTISGGERETFLKVNLVQNFVNTGTEYANNWAVFST